MKKLAHSFLALAAFLALATAAIPAQAQTVAEGQTPGGAHYRIVVPDAWNGALVIWNHGFSLAPIGPVTETDTGLIELIALPQGYAVAASSYQQTGWALFKSNQDLEQLVTVFEDEFGVPDEVVLVGASLGGIVTAAALEKANLGNVTGAFTFCGAVAGSRNWDGALDIRLLYDSICDTKKTSIPGGAKGLPKNSTLTAAQVDKAVKACFGTDSKRKKKQKKRLAKFTELANVPESFVWNDQDGSILMWYTTFGLADLTYDKKKMKGKVGMGNAGVDYGDDEINAVIERVSPKKSKARKLAKNYTPNGNVGNVKIVSLHTDKDGLVIVENEKEWADVVPADQLTVGVVVESQPSHCGFSQAEIIGGWEALRGWIGGGDQPTPEDLQISCTAWEPLVGGPCRIDPDFVIPDMDDRVPPRG